ncbi:hypothetical protein OG851_40535 [Streptomyces sp. NBC_00161]|uniref:hypothetical protein n=1 Tax=Streptomyces sp. NBC_00161 TaxID=2975671 RepID=UPI003255D88F
MIKNLLWRGLPALAVAALPLLTTATASHALDLRPVAAATVASAPAVPGALGVRAPLSLFDAIDRIPVAEEHREGYVRTLYKHWNRGLIASDGCDTRIICTVLWG